VTSIIDEKRVRFSDESIYNNSDTYTAVFRSCIYMHVCMHVVCKQKVNDMSRHVEELHDLDRFELVLVIFNFSPVSLLC
jgi:hypothetical protein